MKMRWKKMFVAVLSLGVASLAYSQQTAPKDVLPPTSVAHPPVSPTLNVSTPDNVAAPSPTPIAITPQAPTPVAPGAPQLPTPGVVETNKLEAAANGQPAGSDFKPPSAWTRTNALAASAWARSAEAASAAKPATNLWPAPNLSLRLWDAGTATGSSGTKTDWK